MRAGLPLLLLAACTPEVHEEVWLVDTIALEGQPKPGYAIGFDLDGVVSPEDDPASCGHGDVRWTDGRVGIDNQFAALLPAMELVAGEAVHALLQDAIDGGDVLITLRLVEEGGEASLEVARAQGPALTGADGALVAGQTLLLDPELPASSTAAHVDGPTLSARGLLLDLPLTILGYELDFTLHEAAIELHREEGRATGVLGGLVSLEQLQPSLDFVNENGDPQIAEPVRTALDANADVDLDPGGDCDHLSLAVRLTAVPAWLYAEGT